MDIDVPKYESYMSGLNCPEVYGTPGDEYYRLLSYLSTVFNGKEIFDLRTMGGCQAYALAFNENNTVHTFDMSDRVTKQQIKRRNNIVFNRGDLTKAEDRQTWIDRLLASPLIFVDVDPHNGSTEYEFYCFLRDHQYQGMLLCDDIWHFKDMRDKFWSLIPQQHKFDLTSYGHWSGTGMIVFTHAYDYLFPRKSSNQNWTLVTAYINLMGTADMNQHVRSKEYYLANANATLSAPYNLVVFCDQGSLEDLKRIRPAHLADQTKYIIVDFDQLRFTGHPGYDNEPFSEFRNKITLNRQKKPYKFDPRNNASYYLFCMARYLMLKQTITENPFGSSHFAWINICIERMGFKNLIHLDETFSANREKFSTCYIDYQPKSLIDDLNEYFREGRCGMCSGFFTGNKKYMYQACHAIESSFLFCMEKGFGHADEQLYSIVYFKHPEIFEHYYGDYAQMITNYCYIYENPKTPLNQFIKNSFGAQAYTKCLEACHYVWNSYLLRKCNLSNEDLKLLCFYEKVCEHEVKVNTVPIPIPPLTQKQMLAGDNQPLPPHMVNVHASIAANVNPANSTAIINPPPELPPPVYKSTIITLLYDVGNPSHISNMLNNAHHWLTIKQPVVIWTDDSCYASLQALFFNKKNVIINKKNIDEFETYQYVDKITGLKDKYEIKNLNLSKDTIQYHMLMYARPYMWAETIKSNPFNTETFICMDFGLYRFTRDLSVVDRWKINDKLKVLLVQQYFQSDLQPKDYFHWTRHNVAGGMMTGSGQNILKYVELFECELKDMMANEWYQLDEALTAIIIRKYPELCDYYYGDYSGIIDNYESVHNIINVPETIQRFLNHRMFVEAQKVIDMIDYQYSSKSLYYFVEYSILTNYYTMDGNLSPVVKGILNDPKNIELRVVIEDRHTPNMSFYKNYETSASEITQVKRKASELEMMIKNKDVEIRTLKDENDGLKKILISHSQL